jgi:transcriptional regulator with XRE-family HTH domain
MGGYGELIRDARKLKRLSQPRLAKKVFVTTRTVSRWETEQSRPSGETLELLAQVLDIELETLEAAIAASTEFDRPVKETGASSDSPTGSLLEAPSDEEVVPGPTDDEPPKREMTDVPAEPLVPHSIERPIQVTDPSRGPKRGLIVVGVFVIAAIGVFLLGPWLKDGVRSPEKEDGSIETQSPTPEQTASNPSTPTVSPTPVPAPKAVLGRDIEPDDEKPCGLQTISAGGSWVFGSVGVDGNLYDAAYRCSMLGGASGELDFTLDKKYSRLHLVAGFASGSEATEHSVQFAFVKDGRFFFQRPFELRYGETRSLDLNVEGVSQISIRLTETSTPGGSETPSTPVVASLGLF